MPHLLTTPSLGCTQIIVATLINVTFLLYELEQSGGVGTFIDAIRSQPVP